jgi:hypothetical protein
MTIRAELLRLGLRAFKRGGAVPDIARIQAVARVGDFVRQTFGTSGA